MKAGNQFIEQEGRTIATIADTKALVTGERANAIAVAALDKKALDVLVLDMKDLVYYTDYLVICSGTSTQHAQAIADNVYDEMAKLGVKPLGIEGRRGALWVLLDYGDVIVHVFERETRDFYELEKLWLDAPRVEVNEN